MKLMQNPLFFCDKPHLIFTNKLADCDSKYSEAILDDGSIGMSVTLTMTQNPHNRSVALEIHSGIRAPCV